LDNLDLWTVKALTGLTVNS